MLGELTGQQQTRGGLNLTACQSALLVVAGQANGLLSKAIKSVVDERVHDAHGLLGDTSLGVHLREGIRAREQSNGVRDLKRQPIQALGTRPVRST